MIQDGLEQIISVENKQLKEMVKSRWTDLETPIIAVPIDYKFQAKESFNSGFFMFTKGALYLFNKKMFSVPVFYDEFHLLNCQRINFIQKSLFFIFGEQELELKFSDQNQSVSVGKLIIKTFRELTYGLDQNNFFQISTDVQIEDIVIQSRPEYSLKWRTLFMAHYYGTKGDYLHLVNYFDVFEQSDTNFLVLNSDLNPGNCAQAYGHAIAWDPKVKFLVLKEFMPNKLQEFLDSLFVNCQFITKLAFFQYHEDYNITFDFNHTFNGFNKDLLIKELSFIQNSTNFMLSFAEQIKYLPFAIETISLQKLKISYEDFIQFICSLSSGKFIKSSLRHIMVDGILTKPFPIDQYMKFLNKANLLSTISFARMDIDATLLFQKICEMSPLSLKNLFFEEMQFQSQECNKKFVDLPPKLIYLSFRKCYFSGRSLRYILNTLTYKPLEIPIFLNLSNINLKRSFYASLSKINFDSIQPNICELIYNNNDLSSESIRYLFAFLFTQKRLRMLSFQNSTVKNTSQFLNYFKHLISSLELPGIDISGNFEKEIFLQFINDLSQFPFLRRVGIRNSHLGDQGLTMFKDVIKSLPQLNELIADGFNPTDANTFCSFWESILNHKSIENCGFPFKDFRLLGQNPQSNSILSSKSDLFEKIQKYPYPTTLYSRIQFMNELAANLEDDQPSTQEMQREPQNQVEINEEQNDNEELYVF